MTFHLSHPDPDAAFQSIARRARVLHVYIIPVCFGTKVPGHCYMPYRHAKEKHWEQCSVKVAFPCVKCHLILCITC